MTYDPRGNRGRKKKLDHSIDPKSYSQAIRTGGCGCGSPRFIMMKDEDRKLEESLEEKLSIKSMGVLLLDR